MMRSSRLRTVSKGVTAVGSEPVSTGPLGVSSASSNVEGGEFPASSSENLTSRGSARLALAAVICWFGEIWSVGCTVRAAEIAVSISCASREVIAAI